MLEYSKLRHDSNLLHSLETLDLKIDWFTGCSSLSSSLGSSLLISKVQVKFSAKCYEKGELHVLAGEERQAYGKVPHHGLSVSAIVAITFADVVDASTGGLRVRVDEKGIVTREDIELCIKEVMEGEKGKEIKRNVKKWKELAKEAVDEGVSLDKNIEDFIAGLVCD
ncbi:hypothetical protein HHK36_032747 [Tetracentron sinense]|uniref:Uncharacterized protein n=1 Tax=Tetracentron sinense TaxID=13715 RepID=A0A835D052_TETSI|nr:hypothetical protein HHK36_032747 [Tetracentron sinense]